MEHVTLSPARIRKNKYVARKLNDLLDILHELKVGLDQVAESVSDKQIRKTITSVALESSQYATEITSKIHSLGGKPHPSSPERKYNLMGLDPKSATDETSVAEAEPEVLARCYSSENFIVKAYRDFLNEYTPYEDVRSLIRAQLNGILCAFVQLKLFNVTLRS
ncbi:DUF2383 domain-containing protein [Dinghuibacter silviterrae]|uniref:Uncharacterized protein (TIGR02284 family) n=1 Tax=Dinghuibacter silviterrae TaxID=1539049 RepID=A0A4R8DE53_9BACT|nr:DUF2383 domain-containing protein [Dinghuibacter silviterrae]TDW95779.1 uncharacterized protein (TIGR02284 family) [Dinghuibacter silviterrae]